MRNNKVKSLRFMEQRSIFWLKGRWSAALLLLVLFSAGCDAQSPEDLRVATRHLLVSGESVALPRPGKPTVLEDGLLWYDIRAQKDLPHMWIIVPEDETPLGTVLVGPFDTGGMPGGRLGPQDRQYLLLYAKNGFSVVGYDIPGFWDDNATDEDIGTALDEYIAADGGVRLISQALDFLEHRLPEALTDRVWAAGEGVSGSIALLTAARDSRIQAVTACDPVVEMTTVFEDDYLRHLLSLRPELEHVLARMSVMEIVPGSIVLSCCTTILSVSPKTKMPCVL